MLYNIVIGQFTHDVRVGTVETSRIAVKAVTSLHWMSLSFGSIYLLFTYMSTSPGPLAKFPEGNTSLTVSGTFVICMRKADSKSVIASVAVGFIS